MNIYKINNWNYHKGYRHITNNDCEAYNSKQNKLFDKKPTFFTLVYELIIEGMIITNYNKRDAGLSVKEFRKTSKIEDIIDILNNYNEVIDVMIKD